MSDAQVARLRRIQRSEILPLGDYEAIRPQFRARVIAEKKLRRLELGPEMSLLFENRDTMLLQIQEMLRTERITKESGIAHELETYNELVPAEGELSATLYIEIPDEARRNEMLERLCSIEEHVAFQVAGEVSRASFEDGRRDKGRAAAVQYLKFPLSPRQIAALKHGESASLVFDHPHYAADHPLTKATRQSLADDL